MSLTIDSPAYFGLDDDEIVPESCLSPGLDGCGECDMCIAWAEGDPISDSGHEIHAYDDQDYESYEWRPDESYYDNYLGQL